MKNNIILVAFFLAGAVLIMPSSANALELSATLLIEGPSSVGVILNRTVPVADTCTIVDTIGGVHTLTGYVGACALKSAKDAGYIANFETKSFSFGLWLESINGIATTPDFSQGWAVWKNGSLANVGVHGLVLAGGDTLRLTYGPWPSALLENKGAGPIITDVFPRKVDAEQMVSFLTAHQEQDGSFGSFLISDWVGIAFGAYKGPSSSAFYAENALKEWLKKNPIPEGRLLTDYERRAMALMALGISPYNGTGTDYIQTILNAFDGKQFGSPNLVNDDIFAVLVLSKAGYEGNVSPLLETLESILSWQRDTGSFGSPDLTAAAIQALSLFPANEQRDKALLKARTYLASQQESSGGFGNVYSTSWALQAIAALHEDGDTWAMEIDRRTPEHFLALRQAPDGGLLQAESKENRIWATSYAVPAALGKSWGHILGAFEKPLAPSLQEDSFVSSVVQNNNGVTASTVEAIKNQIAVLQREVAVLQKLEQIQEDLDRIALEVKAVQVRVIAFNIGQLAENVGQPGTESLAQVPVSASPIGQVNPPTPSQDLSGITLVQEDETAPLAAEAREAVGLPAQAGAQGLSPQLIILIVLIGAAVFAFSGGANTVLPLLRKTFFKV